MSGVCLNLRTNEFSTDIQLLECSQEFDGYSKIKNKELYITFTLLTKGQDELYRYMMKDLYRFVEGQLRVCEKNENVYFSNILLGEGAECYISTFYYLLSLRKYQGVSHRIYVGDVQGHGEFLKRIWNNQI